MNVMEKSGLQILGVNDLEGEFKGMEKYLKNILTIVYLLFFICCNEESNFNNQNKIKNKNNVSDTTNQFENVNKINSFEENSCENIIKKIVISSNGFDSIVKAVKPFLKKEKINISIDEITDEEIRIQLSFKNEEGRNVTLAWFLLNIKKKELSDITIDPENLILLEFDNTLIDKVNILCKD